MNSELFKTMMRPVLTNHLPNDIDNAAELFATAYDLANIGSSFTLLYGSSLIRGDKAILKQNIADGLRMNFSKINPLELITGYNLMATGFCLYWLNSTFTPLPPMPPTIAPTSGTQVLFPGSPTILGAALLAIFRHTSVDVVLSELAMALVLHQLTISGVYNGLLPTTFGTIPLPVPWVIIFSTPPIPATNEDNNVDTGGTDGDGTGTGTGDGTGTGAGDGTGTGAGDGTGTGAGGDTGTGTGAGGGTGTGTGAGGGTGTGTGSGGGTGTGTGSGGGTGTGAGGGTGTGTGAGGGTGTGTGAGGGTGTGTGASGGTGTGTGAGGIGVPGTGNIGTGTNTGAGAGIGNIGDDCDPPPF